MSKYLILSAALWLAAGSCAIAAPYSLERAMETSTQAVSLPDSIPATIDARGCLQCKSIRMEVPATARLFIGKDQVTLKELRDYARGKNLDMVILYELDSNVVRRIIVAGTLPKSTSQAK